MANWQFTIHLADLFHRAKKDGASIQQLAAAVVFNLEQIRRSADPLIDVDVDALAYEFQDIADEPDATAEEYDTALRHLFDWNPDDREPRNLIRWSAAA